MNELAARAGLGAAAAASGAAAGLTLGLTGGRQVAPAGEGRVWREEGVVARQGAADGRPARAQDIGIGGQRRHQQVRGILGAGCVRALEDGQATSVPAGRDGDQVGANGAVTVNSQTQPGRRAGLQRARQVRPQGVVAHGVAGPPAAEPVRGVSRAGRLQLRQALTHARRDRVMPELTEAEVRRHLGSLAAPPGGLGELRPLAERLCLVQQTLAPVASAPDRSARTSFASAWCSMFQGPELAWRG